MAASNATREVLWLRQLISEIDEKQDSGIILCVNNQSAIELIKNAVFHRRLKHIEVAYHYIREKFEENITDIKYVPSAEQVADIFTKGLPKATFQKICSLLGMKNRI